MIAPYGKTTKPIWLNENQRERLTLICIKLKGGHSKKLWRILKQSGRTAHRFLALRFYNKKQSIAYGREESWQIKNRQKLGLSVYLYGLEHNHVSFRTICHTQMVMVHGRLSKLRLLKLNCHAPTIIGILINSKILLWVHLHFTVLEL